MIYILEKNFNRQIDILEFFIQKNSYRVCAWLYPESTSKNIADIPILNNILDLETITSYSNGYIPSHTKILSTTFETLAVFKSSQKEIQENIDNIALYPLKSNQWEIAIIPHEGICLAKDENYLSELLDIGFNATLESPSWW